MAKRKIKVLRNLGTEFVMTNAEGQKLAVPVPPEKRYKEGQVVDVDEKEADQLLAASLAEVPHDIDVPASADDLEAQTVVDLHEVARKESINLHGVTAKDDIIKAIRKARKK